MSAAAITKGLPRLASIQSSMGMPMTAAGTQATMVFAHRSHVSRRSPELLLGEKGFNRWKNITQTARIAPSWMTTRNMFQKSSDTSMLRNWLSSSM